MSKLGITGCQDSFLERHIPAEESNRSEGSAPDLSLEGPEKPLVSSGIVQDDPPNSEKHLAVIGVVVYPECFMRE
jgi:hypothetical protein